MLEEQSLRLVLLFTQVLKLKKKLHLKKKSAWKRFSNTGLLIP